MAASTEVPENLREAGVLAGSASVAANSEVAVGAPTVLGPGQQGQGSIPDVQSDSLRGSSRGGSVLDSHEMEELLHLLDGGAVVAVPTGPNGKVGGKTPGPIEGTGSPQPSGLMDRDTADGIGVALVAEHIGEHKMQHEMAGIDEDALLVTSVDQSPTGDPSATAIWAVPTGKHDE